MSDEADHLMQLHATVYDGCHGDQGAHIGVHLLVHQPEGQALIANQSLQRQSVFHYSYVQAELMQTSLAQHKTL